MSSKFLDKTGLDTLWAKIKSTFQTLGNLVTAWGSTPSDTKYPSEKLVKTALDGKVDKETDKGLSANDYTTAEKNKLAGIAEGAEVNVQSDWNQTDSTADDYIKNKPKAVLWLTYGSTYTKTQVDGWITDGYLLCVSYNSKTYKLGRATSYQDTNYYTFSDEMDYVRLTIDNSTSAWTDGTNYPTAASIGAAESSHSHGNISNDGKSASEPTNTTKFLRADGTWHVPPKSLQYWSGGSTNIKGVYIGTCVIQNGWNAWITGTMSITNYHNSNPNTASGKGIALGLFYLWAFRSGNAITASCRLYSLNARHINTDIMLVYKKDTSDDTRYKVHFYVCFGPGTTGGGTSTNQRPFGLGINYLENHNADIPAALTGITSDIRYDDDYYSVLKMPYLSQNAASVGSSTNPVYVNSNGGLAACKKLVQAVTSIDTSNMDPDVLYVM